MIADPLNGVTTFLAVAETNSFTAAAARLGVTPTAVSKAIRLLEGRHGVTLFQRTTRRVALTEAGNAIFLRLRPAGCRIAATTFQPFFAKCRAVALPMPLEAPVITMVLALSVINRLPWCVPPNAPNGTFSH